MLFSTIVNGILNAKFIMFKIAMVHNLTYN